MDSVHPFSPSNIAAIIVPFRSCAVIAYSFSAPSRFLVVPFPRRLAMLSCTRPTSLRTCSQRCGQA